MSYFIQYSIKEYAKILKSEGCFPSENGGRFYKCPKCKEYGHAVHGSCYYEIIRRVDVCWKPCRICGFVIETSTFYDREMEIDRYFRIHSRTVKEVISNYCINFSIK